MFWISSSDNPELDFTVNSDFLPVEASEAVTFKIPSTLISKVTSIFASPRLIAGIPVKSKRSNNLLYLARERSPWKIEIVTVS